MSGKVFIRAMVDVELVDVVRAGAEQNGCSVGDWLSVAIRQLAARESARRKRDRDEEQEGARS